MGWVDVEDVAVVEPDEAVGAGEAVEEFFWGEVFEFAAYGALDIFVDDDGDVLEGEIAADEFAEADFFCKLEGGFLFPGEG